MKTIRERMEELIFIASEQLNANPVVEQIIVLETVKNNRYICMNYEIVQGNCEDENQFIQRLVDADDVEVKYVVCMWKNGGVDIPSVNFRRRLLACCSKNENTVWVGQGECGLIYKTIKDTIIALY